MSSNTSAVKTASAKTRKPRKLTFEITEVQGVRYFVPRNRRAQAYAFGKVLPLSRTEVKTIVRKSKGKVAAYASTSAGLRKVA